MIEPRILKGFKDSLPNEEFYKKNLINKIEKILNLFGYLPIDTPAIEYQDILLGKGGGETDKQVFLFKDKGERDVGLRYDLTVPLARFVAMHENELTFPFKRYHIAKVWRGEKPQKGRFREFYQADFDIIGVNSVESDIEIILLIYSLLTDLGIKDIIIKINDRELMHQIFEKLNVENYEKEILLILDKYYKVSQDQIIENLKELIGNKNIEIIKLIQNANNGNFFNILKTEYGIENTRLEKIFKIIDKINLNKNIILDCAITRGLDYYTGIVFESFIKDAIELGSVCSGGRYENLTSTFCKNKYSAIGGSIGLDRLLYYLIEKKMIDKISYCLVLIANLNEEDYLFYLDILKDLHDHKISSEIYLTSTKLKKQFKYAEDKNIPYLLITGEEEKNKGILKLKNIKTGEEFLFHSIEEISNYLKKPQNSINF